MLPFLVPIVSMLAGKGLDLLTNTLSSASDKGVDKIKDFIEEKTGLDITSEDQVSQMSAEQIVELQRLTFEEKKFFEDVALKYKQMEYEDRKDARDMQKEAIKQTDLFTKRFNSIFASAITTLAFAYCFCVTFITIPERNVRIADTILGFLLGTAVAAIINFYFGSSGGSKEKDEQIAALIAQAKANSAN